MAHFGMDKNFSKALLHLKPLFVYICKLRHVVYVILATVSLDLLIISILIDLYGHAGTFPVFLFILLGKYCSLFL